MTVAMTVSGAPTPNNTPVAGDDSYKATAGKTLTVRAPGVLRNDTDADGDRLTAVLASSVAHGTLKLSANGSFAYTPSVGFSGTDIFAYQASDGHSLSGTAVVTITVAKRGK
jgi:VCBS repeat-containing protein